MAALTLTGKVEKIGNVIEISETFTKRELWLEIDRDTDYPQIVNIEFIKDKTSLLDKYSVGDEITVDINVRGNKTKNGDRCFNSLNGWRIAGMASGKDDGGDYSQPESTDDSSDDPPF